MNEPFTLLNVLTGILLSLTCAACGRAAVAPQLRLDNEPRTVILDEMNRASDTNRFALEDAAAARAQRQLPDDSSLQHVRATRSGWAASDAR